MRTIILAAALFLICHTPYLQAQEISFPEKISTVNTSKFQLEITGFKKVEGEVRVAVFNTKEAYTKDPVHAVVLTVDEETVTWSVDDLPQGEYAIAVYHDKNTNGKLDTNFLGIPKESYGFSNNARGRFGPASWDDAKFKVEGDEHTHSIIIK